MNISVVIPTNGKREKELVKIVDYLKRFGFDDINIVQDTGNCMLGRYLAETRYDIIYTQDDDCLVGNIQELIDNHDPNFIVNNITTNRANYYTEMGISEITLVGYGAIYNKKLIENMSKYQNKYGLDALYRREADRVFTYLNNKISLVRDDKIINFPSAVGGLSVENNHEQSMLTMVERLRTL